MPIRALTAGLLLLNLAAPLGAVDEPIVPDGARLEKLWGEGEFTEGPVYGPGQRVYFSDIGNRLMKKRLLHDFGKQRGIDGMCVDARGNIYGAAGEGKAGGVYVFSPEGKQLTFIPAPEVPSNCAFGDRDHKSLYITAGKSLYRIKLNNEGFAVYWPK